MNKKGFTISELLTVFVIVLLLIGLLYPLTRYTVERSDNANCRENLRVIGVALYMYASENEGRFPERLDELYEQEYLTEKALLDCPASSFQGTLNEPDYLYRRGLTVRCPSEEILLKDNTGNHPGGENSLFVDGRVVTW